MKSIFVRAQKSDSASNLGYVCEWVREDGIQKKVIV